MDGIGRLIGPRQDQLQPNGHSTPGTNAALQPATILVKGKEPSNVLCRALRQCVHICDFLAACEDL